MSRLLILSLLCRVQYFTEVTEQTSCSKSCGFAHTPAWNRTGNVNSGFFILVVPDFLRFRCRLRDFRASELQLQRSDGLSSFLVFFFASRVFIRPCLSPSRASSTQPSHVHTLRLCSSVLMLRVLHYKLLNRGVGSNNVIIAKKIANKRLVRAHTVACV